MIISPPMPPFKDQDEGIFFSDNDGYTLLGPKILLTVQKSGEKTT